MEEVFIVPSISTIVGDKPDNIAKIQVGITIFLILALVGVVLGIMAHHNKL